MAITLLAAIKNGDQKNAKQILQQRTYSNIDSQSSRNDGTALFWACCQGFIELVHLLILHGADVNGRTSWGSTPLHASVDNNREDIVKLLLRFGADVNARTKNGDSPCHLAAYRGYGGCVQALAEYGADPLMSNNKHHTPVDEARSKGHYDIYQYLLAVQRISLKYKTGSSLPPERTSLQPTWPTSITSSKLTNSLDSLTTDSSSSVSSFNSDVTDNGYMLKDKLVGQLHLPKNNSFLRGETSTSSSLSSYNDLSSIPSGSSVSEPAMSFRNIP